MMWLWSSLDFADVWVQVQEEAAYAGHQPSFEGEWRSGAKHRHAFWVWRTKNRGHLASHYFTPVESYPLSLKRGSVLIPILWSCLGHLYNFVVLVLFCVLGSISKKWVKTPGFSAWDLASDALCCCRRQQHSYPSFDGLFTFPLIRQLFVSFK